VGGGGGPGEKKNNSNKNSRGRKKKSCICRSSKGTKNAKRDTRQKAAPSRGGEEKEKKSENGGERVPKLQGYLIFIKPCDNQWKVELRGEGLKLAPAFHFPQSRKITTQKGGGEEEKRGWRPGTLTLWDKLKKTNLGGEGGCRNHTLSQGEKSSGSQHGKDDVRNLVDEGAA